MSRAANRINLRTEIGDMITCGRPLRKKELIAPLGLLGRDGGRESLGGGRTHGSRGTSSTGTVSAKPLDVEELEMLLEAYFVQVDGTLNKLSTVRSYAHS